MFQVVLPNDLEKLPELTRRLGDFVAAEGISSHTAYKLNLVVEELFVNFVHHGAARNGKLELTLSRLGETLHLHIEDEGAAFNPLTAQEPDTKAPLQDRDAGGLGLHLIRELSEDISYERKSNRNVIDVRIGL